MIYWQVSIAAEAGARTFKIRLLSPSYSKSASPRQRRTRTMSVRWVDFAAPLNEVISIVYSRYAGNNV